MKFVLMLSAVLLSMSARAQTPQLWTCSLTCSSVSTRSFMPKKSTNGLVELKHAKDYSKSKTVRSLKIWPLGYEFKLDSPGPSRPSSDSQVAISCDGSGGSAQKAMQDLENHITGKNLSIMVKRCDGCNLGQLKDAFCDEAKSGVSIAYPVLKSRMNPTPQVEAPTDSTGHSSAVQRAQE